jgi:hypothetical protein
LDWRQRSAVLSSYAVETRYPGAELANEIPRTFLIIEEALLAFRAFSKEKLGAHWVEV